MSLPNNWKQNLAMFLTTLRMILVIPIIILLQFNSQLSLFSAAMLFIIASITDYYDGYFARKYNAVSNMGKFMDPIADKVLVTTVLTLLIIPGKIDPYLVILLSTRDTIVGGLRAIAAADGLIISAKPTGKIKTGLQMVGIPMTIVGHMPFQPENLTWFQNVGYGLLWISAILSMVSGLEYWNAYSKAQKGKSHV